MERYTRGGMGSEKLLLTSTLGQRREYLHLPKAKNGGYHSIASRDWGFMKKTSVVLPGQKLAGLQNLGPLSCYRWR